MYDLFGKYGAIRQIRLGNEAKTRGTAYVIYEDIADASDKDDESRIPPSTPGELTLV